MTDIAPDLYDDIKDEIEKEIGKSTKIQAIMKKIQNGSATHKETEAYSLELGKITSKVLQNNIALDEMPDDTFYYNISERTVGKTLEDNLDRVNAVGKQVQADMNKKAGFGLAAVAVTLNTDRIHSLVSALSNCEHPETLKELLQEPIINTTQSYADEFVEVNAEAQYNAGLAPVLVRTADPGCCDWCSSLEGTYDYPVTDESVYQRHENCRCTVEYYPRDGRGIQNAHTKTWKEDPADLEARKTYGL